MTTYFISRHPGAIAWAEQEGFHVDIQLMHFEPETVKRDDVVLGTLPVNLIADVNAQGGRYFHLALDLPSDQRGKELSADEMRAYGARLEEFAVKRL